MRTRQSRSGSRLIIVSNRLPVTVEDRDGKPKFMPSSGGLATGLGALGNSEDLTWVGWPGQVSRSNQAQVAERLEVEHGCKPVFLSDRLVEKYYEGFSNRTIWPLFHSFQGFTKYSATEWNAYREANEKFLQTLDDVIQPGDKVWIHDYQLLLLPGLLRARYPDLVIGFFLHIPFPSFDVLRLMPQHREILQSLLAADLVGFHTNDYARAFLNGVHRTMGLEDRLGQIICGERVVQTIVHPMGIDFDSFSSAAKTLHGKPEEIELQKSLGKSKTIFSVSRLDYTKGIPQALASFEHVLEKRHDLREKVAFILSVVPSREKVDRYAHLKREIDEIVGRVNAKFGSVSWTPIRYLYRHLTHDELILLYKNSDVAFVTPLRDGMNLVAKEYVATKNDETGVLVLSEMAGAAKELLEALIVNPNSREEMAEALEKALSMPETEQKQRMQSLRERLLESQVKNWAKNFVSKLDQTSLEGRRMTKAGLSQEHLEKIRLHSREAKKRLFVLDYDGTLMPLMNDPTKVSPDDELKTLLESLDAKPDDTVVVLSGRAKDQLGAWLEDTGVSLGAEHGAWVKWNQTSQWTRVLSDVSVEWKRDASRALESFVEKIPGSWIEDKEFSLVWHYRRAERESADTAAKDLIFHLLSVIGDHPVRIVPGNRSIEIRCVGIGKGSFLRSELKVDDFDFVLVAGDDLTDEDLFGAVPQTAVSIKVGSGFSKARYRVRDHSELREFLSEIAPPKKRPGTRPEARPEARTELRTELRTEMQTKRRLDVARKPATLHVVRKDQHSKTRATT